MKCCIILGICCLISFNGWAQTQYLIKGATVNSQTFEPVPIVYVQSLLTKTVTITDDNGEFQISTSLGDSLRFTRLGYDSKKVFVGISNEPMIVKLLETETVLSTVSVYGSYKLIGKEAWTKSIRTPKPTDNFTQKPGNGYVVQALAVNYTIIGPFSYFLKSEKEKRTLKKVKDEHNKTYMYRMVMGDPETKTQIMDRFSITLEKYDAKVEKFTSQYPDAAYLQTRIEILDLLYYFFSLKE